MLEALIFQLKNDLDSALRASTHKPLPEHLRYQLRLDLAALRLLFDWFGFFVFDSKRVAYARGLYKLARNLALGRRANGRGYDEIAMCPQPLQIVSKEEPPWGLGCLPDNVTTIVLAFACGAVRINGMSISSDVVTASRLKLIATRFERIIDKQFPVAAIGITRAKAELSSIQKAVKSRLQFSDARGFELTARQILKQFPPSEYVYLGVGASPVPCLAQINLLAGSATVINMPLSNIKENNFDVLLRSLQGREVQTALFKYFDNFLSAKVVGQKRVLLIDFVDKGFSLRLVRAALCTYYDSADRVHVFALARMGDSAKLVSKEVPKEALTSVSLTDDPDTVLKNLMQSLWFEMFKKRNYIMFGKVDVGEVMGGKFVEAPKPNLGAYQRLLKHLLDPLSDEDEGEGESDDDERGSKGDRKDN